MIALGLIGIGLLAAANAVADFTAAQIAGAGRTLRCR